VCVCAGGHGRRDAVHFPHRSGGGKGRKGRTDQVGVVRREFLMQLDGVRLVDRIPERLPASDDVVDVFRVDSPGKEATRERVPSARWRASNLEQVN
jgi:hypothetical protein